MSEEKLAPPHLTVIKGGKISEQEFTRLPFPDKLAALRHQPARKRLDFLLADTEGKALAASMQPQELYWIVREVGETDSLPLLDLASPEQYAFMLDMELWDKWSFSSERAIAWIGYLVDAGEEKVLEHVHHLDFELLLLFLKKEISIGGGYGDFIDDEQRLADWDHSFDGIFHITFLNKQNARLIGTFLDIIYRNDANLYLGLMTGVQTEVESELEELCWQFRTARMEDEGFPSLDDALSIYAFTDPASFVPAGDKILQDRDGVENPPQLLPVGDLLLQRALARIPSVELQMELNHLVNSALVADDTAFDNSEGVEQIGRRVHGYLNIALEYLAGADDERAASILAREKLSRLFRLGYSLVARLQKRAEKLSSDNYAVSKALLGLKSRRPNFYRGLDPDRTDGYREFRGMTDIGSIDEFLHRLER